MTSLTDENDAIEDSWRDEEDDIKKTSYFEVDPRRARRLARVLYSKYQSEAQRWRSYVSLFTFLAFAGLLTIVLYLQSNAQVAYQVHATIQSIVPPTTTMESRNGVLQWLQQTLREIWRDPICGDGVCSTPFEFPSYGRFGCRADCGKLPEIEQVTTLQIDLSYDFHHPAASIASAELMHQASWNLCPKNGAPHGMDCYFIEAQRFESLKGEEHLTLDDVPDGEWEIQVKRDFFNKIQGAVRVVEQMREQAMSSRIYGAYLAAYADQSFELKLLQRAISIAETPIFDYVIEELRSDLTQSRSLLLNQLTDGTVIQSEFDNANATLQTDYDFNLEQYTRAICLCPGIQFEIECTDPTITAFLTETGTDSTPRTETEICDRYERLTSSHFDGRLSRVREILTTERNGGSSTYPGKIGTRAAKKAEQRYYITKQAPELEGLIFDSGDGLSPDTDLFLNNTKYDTLAKYFSDGPTGYVDPSQLTAQLGLGRSATQTSTIADLLNRATDRVSEIERQRTEVKALEPVQRVLQKHRETDSILPNDVGYNQVAWSGDADAYLTCNLELRGPEYLGQCVKKITCARDQNTDPYSCTDTPDRPSEECGAECSFQDDCQALCECGRLCGADQFCTCDACVSLIDALATAEYKSLQALAESADPIGRRRLREDTEDDSIAQHLSDLSLSVDALRIGQTDLKAQVLSLEEEVQVANDLAKTRENDDSLKKLIDQGRTEISKGQEAVEAMLIEIIGKQNATLEAVEEATETVKTLEAMTAKSLEAQASIQIALREQMNAIKIAYQQNLITLGQAGELWKLARRERLVTEKHAQLSNYRCSPETVVTHSFEVDNYVETDTDRSRERYVGLANRIIGGLLLHSTRTRPRTCSDTRFIDIQSGCRGDISSDPYGVDPVFKSGTTMYNPDLDNENSVMHFYNCSELHARTDFAPDPSLSDQAPGNTTRYCAELYNRRHVPYGFHAMDLDGKIIGFPVWIDINLSELDADRWYHYIEEGLYLDGNTRSMTAEMVLYNGDLNVFGYVEVGFDFTDGGAIKTTHRISTTKANLYETSIDFFRLALELILTGVVIGWVAYDIRLLLLNRRVVANYGSGETSLDSISTWLEFVSSILMLVGVGLWWNHVLTHAIPFDIELSYGVYNSLSAPAAYLKLAKNGNELRQVNDRFRKMKLMVDSLSWYYAVNGLSILLLIARLLKRMDFQPRLGVVTRSLALAGSDILHFTVVAGFVFFGYAMMGQLIFGSSILSFSTFSRSVNTCFEVLLGEISVNADLKDLSGLQAVAGILYFWSFELLVFLVLLNFLLAIIVDAFSIVKENTSETTGIHTEIIQMIQSKWQDFIKLCSDRSAITSDRLAAVLHGYGEQNEEKTDDIVSQERPTTIQIGGDSIDVKTLKSVLYTCLTDSKDKGTSIGSLLPMSSKTSTSPIPTDQDLQTMASALLQRLGTIHDCVDRDEDTSLNEVKQLLLKWDAELKDAQSSLFASLDNLASVQKEILRKQQCLMSNITSKDHSTCS